MASEERGSNGIELEGFGSKVSAHGRNSLIVLGFLVLSGAIIYDGWLMRAAVTSQTNLLTQVFVNQKEFIEGYVNKAGQDHVELKSLCLHQRFMELGRGAPTP